MYMHEHCKQLLTQCYQNYATYTTHRDNDNITLYFFRAVHIPSTVHITIMLKITDFETCQPTKMEFKLNI